MARRGAPLLAEHPDFMTERSLCLSEMIHGPADAVVRVRSYLLPRRAPDATDDS